MSHRERDLQMSDKSLNGTHRFRFVLTKDGEVWTDVDSVTLSFQKPDRSTSFDRECVAEDIPSGIWYYTTVAGDLDTAGYWLLGVTVVDDEVELEYPYDIAFRVKARR